MKNHFLLGLLVIGLLYSCQQEKATTGLLQTKDVQRMVLVGGSLVSNMEDYGFFERSILQHYPVKQVSFRNIGWPADDVYGLARSQFGSAQNTRSWEPPSAEKGFGSKVLMQHIKEASPTTLLLAYGAEAAFFEAEEDLTLFTSGYERLLDFAEEQGAKLVLLSPPKQEVAFSTKEVCETRNNWLAKAASFIKETAEVRGHIYIDLYEGLVTNPSQHLYTNNGIQLNETGYERMNDLLLEQLQIKDTKGFNLTLDADAKIVSNTNCEVSDWTKTVNGVSFNLTADKMLSSGEINSKGPIAIFVNGELYSKKQDTVSTITLKYDSIRQERLLTTIKEKNRLHRYRLRPLNEAYIYLFRRHEMGHLAYEMDMLNELVVEKEREIQRLVNSQTHDIEIELIRDWQPPKDYPEDEVPAFVPEPDIAAELAAFNIADGYEISLFAADPMIANPINVNWDTKGRAWVATSSTYPHIVPGREPNDKIIILEDTDGDGVADKHTVFAENLLVPHSVMPVPGGAFVTATTQLLFLADTDGDDVADERRVVFDGFGNADVHHMIHGLRWAPWGDLYFTQSIYINSFIETAFGTKVLNGSGTWMFRPETEQLEVFSRGLVNPWGHAFDQWGQAFATDGAHFTGVSYVFPESAHATAVGAVSILPGLNNNTPKNTAAELIYSRHFPADWQGSVITNDFRANRTVRYALQTSESGYVSEEVETVLRSDHRSYRPVDSKIGPDGALYIVDWYNPIIDHGEVDFHHPIRDKSHGRIWKLTRKGRPLLPIADLQNASTPGLLSFLKSPEQFTRLQANRAYVERKGDPQAVINWINNLSKGVPDYYRHRVEGLWLLRALNHFDEPTLMASLRSSNPREKGAAVRLLSHWGKQTDHAVLLASLVNDPHPQVRLETIHALRELGGKTAAETVLQILDHPVDVNLTYALDLSIRSLQEQWLPALLKGEQLFDGAVNKQLYALLATGDKRGIPLIDKLLGDVTVTKELRERAWFALAQNGDATIKAKVLEKAIEEEELRLLRALANAGEADEVVPTNVQLIQPLFTHDSLALRIAALNLAGHWKTTQYKDEVSQRVKEGSVLREKLAALRALVGMDDLAQVEALALTASDPKIQTTACAVWIEEAPEAAASNAVAILSKLEDPDLAELLFITFRKMENGPRILEESLAGKSIPEKMASEGLKVVQTSGLNLKSLDEALRKAGDIKPLGAELTRAEKDELIQAALQVEGNSRGRQLYRRPELLCATCHKVQGVGGMLGPDLSSVGAYMTPNSILESILRPNSDIKQGYETVVLTKKNGEVVSGLLHRKTNNATLIRQPNNDIIEIPSTDIEVLDVSAVSLMPAGLTGSLHKDELRDLLAYLISLGKEE